MFRISLLLWLVALAALNFTLFRYSEAIIDLSPKFAGLIGLIPLFDLFGLSLYLAVTRRFRFALVRRTVRKSRGFGRDGERSDPGSGHGDMPPVPRGCLGTDRAVISVI